MKNPFEAVSLSARSFGQSLRRSLFRSGSEEERKPVKFSSSQPLEIKPVSLVSIEVGLPDIVVSSEDIPSGDILPMGDSYASMGRLTNEERGQILWLKERVRELSMRLQDYLQFQNSVKVDIKALNDNVEHLERVIDDMKDLRDGYSSVEKNLHELSALYDLISTQFNPFIDSAPAAALSVAGSAGGVPGDGALGLLEGNGGEPKISEIDLLQWISFLVTRIEAKQLPYLLKNYEENGVISTELRSKTLKFLKSIKPAGIKPQTRNDWRLSVEDQITSLELLTKARGRPPATGNGGS